MHSFHKLIFAPVAVLALVATAASQPASAHAFLVKAVPPVGGTIADSPARISITFTEAVEPSFSGIALTAGNGRKIPTGKSIRLPSDETTLVTQIKATLSPGTYTVRWHAVAIDTHRTQGSFTFKVKR